MKRIEVTANGTRLCLKSNNLAYEVERDGFCWISQGRKPHVIFQKKVFGKYLWFPQAFAWAKNVSHKVCEDSIVSSFSGFKLLGKTLPVRLEAVAKITEDGKVDFSIEAFNEEDVYLKAVFFPQPFNAKKAPKNSYSVDPIRQGTLIPDKWQKNKQQLFLMTKYWRKINTGDAYLGLWGRVCGDKGYSAVVEDSNDCTVFSCFGKNQAFLTSANWYASLGKLAYKRTVHFRFMNDCDYVKIAKDYRINEIKKGEFKTIDEKIKENPNVAKLIGTPVIHWRLVENNVPESGIYKQTKVGMVVHNTFSQTEERFKRFKELGLEKAYVHTDGWGFRGYDNLHPYILPPSPEAGGYEGMKKLSETCEELGYEFGLHDQYRDYYRDSPVYDEKLCIYDVNMKKSYCDFWAGGAHNWLDSTLAKPFVKRTYEELEENGVKVKGTYLDVWGIMWGDENHNPDHLTTRKQSIEARGDCIKMLREKGLIVSSEELGCNMVKYLDLVHHAPYALTPQEGGIQVGVPIPLANLVFHDCVFVPWIVDGEGGWGIPNGDQGRLHCILNGQTPYFDGGISDELNDEALKERIKNVREIAQINAAVYNAEMLSHKFLDKNYRVQQTVFSNGVTITVDFDKGSYSVEKA